MNDRAVLVSGASGFIGRSVTARLASSGYEVVVALRRPREVPGAARAVDVGDLAAPAPALDIAMRGVTAVIHAAGLAHRTGVDPAAMAAANVVAARRVAEAAVARGVPRLILVSSAAVFGKQRSDVFDESSEPGPDDAYAASKLEGEGEVRKVIAGSGTRLVIVRPCAVVGPGCAGNVRRLVRLVRLGMPLPFGGIRNLRSFISVDDLARLIERAVDAPDPPDCVIAAHPEPIGTPDLIRSLARGLGRRIVLLPAPSSWLETAARMAGRGELWRSFAGTFHADVDLARITLGFSAVTPVPQALETTAAAMR